MTTNNYVIDWSDAVLKPPFLVQEGSIDVNTTSLVIDGQNSVDWGEGLNEDWLKLLENFASGNITPGDATQGQTWFNYSFSGLTVWYDPMPQIVADWQNYFNVTAGLVGQVDVMGGNVAYGLGTLTRGTGDLAYWNGPGGDSATFNKYDDLQAVADAHPSLKEFFKNYYGLGGPFWHELSERRIGAATPPYTNPDVGDLWYDTTVDFLKVYTNNGTWVKACLTCVASSVATVTPYATGATAPTPATQTPTTATPTVFPTTTTPTATTSLLSIAYLGAFTAGPTKYGAVGQNGSILKKVAMSTALSEGVWSKDLSTFIELKSDPLVPATNRMVTITRNGIPFSTTTADYREFAGYVNGWSFPMTHDGNLIVLPLWETTDSIAGTGDEASSFLVLEWTGVNYDEDRLGKPTQFTTALATMAAAGNTRDHGYREFASSIGTLTIPLADDLNYNYWQEATGDVGNVLIPMMAVANPGLSQLRFYTPKNRVNLYLNNYSPDSTAYFLWELTYVSDPVAAVTAITVTGTEQGTLTYTGELNLVTEYAVGDIYQFNDGVDHFMLCLVPGTSALGTFEEVDSIKVDLPVVTLRGGSALNVVARTWSDAAEFTESHASTLSIIVEFTQGGMHDYRSIPEVSGTLAWFGTAGYLGGIDTSYTIDSPTKLKRPLFTSDGEVHAVEIGDYVEVDVAALTCTDLGYSVPFAGGWVRTVAINGTDASSSRNKVIVDGVTILDVTLDANAGNLNEVSDLDYHVPSGKYRGIVTLVASAGGVIWTYGTGFQFFSYSTSTVIPARNEDLVAETDVTGNLTTIWLNGELRWLGSLPYTVLGRSVDFDNRFYAVDSLTGLDPVIIALTIYGEPYVYGVIDVDYVDVGPVRTLNPLDPLLTLPSETIRAV